MTEPARAASPPRQLSRPDGPAPGGSASFIWTVRQVVVCALLTAFALGSSSGATVADTKLDLVVDPVGFLQRALHLWDPLGASGQLQNQAYGYLFPMGPFFALGHLAGAPAWVVQRLWWSVVLCVGFTGVVALARRLRVGSPAGQLLAGAAFAVSPHLLTVLGPVSAEAWPMALAPWVLVPLVSDAAATRSARRTAFLSGVPVLCMGGVNATLVLAAVVPAMAWFATRRLDRALAALAGWWALAVLLACSWWLVPLLLLGRFSPPFLGYIESASVTTSTTNLVEVLRGTHDWIGYLSASGSTAGAMLLTSPVLVLLTGAVAAAGVAGLFLPAMPHRRWLLASLAAGVVLVTLGHVGSVDGFGSQTLRAALDGALAPLRNVHKFDVAVRLPLVLGLAALVDALGRGRSVAETRATRALVFVAALFAVLGAAVPLLSMKAAPAQGFSAVPGYWSDAARWLDHADATGRTLLAPGSRFGVYDWGNTNDEPLQPLARQPWDVRNTIPLTTTGHIRWLDSVEHAFSAGRGGPGLVTALKRGGVRYVLVRNDLDYGAVGATSPVLVHQALEASADVVRVATFGPTVGSRGSVTLAYDQFLNVPYPALEVFEIRGGGDSRVTVTPRSQVQQVQGGSESLVALQDAGQLGSGAALLTSSGTVLTDTPRRRETSFAGGAANESATLSATDPLRIDKPSRDYDAGEVAPAEARLDGVRAVEASSSAADADAVPSVDQSAMPYSAIDGSPRTAWRPNPGLPVAQQWLSVDFGRVVDLSRTHLTVVPGSQLRSVTVKVAGRSATTRLDGATSVDLRVPVARAAGLRLQLGDRVAGADLDAPLGVSELAVPGVTVSRTVVLAPSTTPVALRAVVLTTSGRRDSCVSTSARTLCATGRSTAGEDAAGLDRTFTSPTSQRYAVQATVVPTPGAPLDRLLRRAAGGPVSATGSSAAVPDPGGSAASAVDGDLGTAWVADPADARPSLELRWHGARRISHLRLVLDPAVAATAPTEVTITSPAGNRVVAVGADGEVLFDTLATDRLTMLVRAPTLASSYDPAQRRLVHLGVGVSEVEIPRVTHTATAAALDAVRSRPVHLGCGQGPGLFLDDQAFATRVDTTVDALRRLQPMVAQPCGLASLTVQQGTHRVRLPGTQTWTPDGVVLAATESPESAPTADPPTPEVRTGRWDPTHRAVTVGPRREETVLTVHENANEGWHATVAGRELRRVTVDGWQQGYVVPGGTSTAVVHLDFAPDRLMRSGLALGLLAAFALLLGAVVPGRRGGSPRAVTPRVGTGPSPAVVGLVVLAAAGGWVGLAVGAAAALAWSVASRHARAAASLPWLAAGCYLAAVVRLAVDPWGSTSYAAGSAPAQTLCLLALGLGFAVPVGTGASSAARGTCAPTGAGASSAASPETGGSAQSG